MPEDALRQQIRVDMGDARGGPAIGQGIDQRGGQTESPVGHLQENRPNIGAGVLIERRCERAIEEVWGRRAVCGTLGSFNSDASVWQKSPSACLLDHSQAFMFLPTHTGS
jgi:hypothetical protein